MLPPDLSIERSTVVDGDMIAIRTMLEMYRQNTGKYPSTKEGLEALVTRPSTGDATPMWRQLARQAPVDPWGSLYVYRWPGTTSPDTFDLFSYGPDGIESTDDISVRR